MNENSLKKIIEYFKGKSSFSSSGVDFSMSGNNKKDNKETIKAFFESFDNGEFSLFAQISAIHYAWNSGYISSPKNDFFNQEIENYIPIDNLWNPNRQTYEQTNVFEVEGINYTIQTTNNQISIYKDLDYLSTEEKKKELKTYYNDKEVVEGQILHLKEDVKNSWWYGRTAHTLNSYDKADNFFNKNKIILQYPGDEWRLFLGTTINTTFNRVVTTQQFTDFFTICKLQKIDIENIIMVSRQIAQRKFLISDLNYKKQKKNYEDRIAKDFDFSDFD